MLAVDATINRVRRDITLGTLLKALFACAAVACFVMAGTENVRVIVLLGIGALWFWLSLNGARTSRVAAESPSLIAAGQFEEAERNIEHTVRTFSLIRGVKLQALHHLALLRHAQRRWQESAVLAEALLGQRLGTLQPISKPTRLLLGQRLGTLQPISKPTRLLLADSLLEMNDVRGAYESLTALSQERLSLQETLNLLLIQLDYSARVGAWSWMANGVMQKVELAELMPSASSARAQAFLALAAKKIGRNDLADWLRGRAELLTDVTRLTSERPILRELWPQSQPTESAP